LISTNCVRYGDFPLSGGGRSNYFIDCGKLWLSDRLCVVVDCLWDALQPLPRQVGGPSVGADPLIGALLLLARMMGQPLSGFVVKKDGSIQGDFRPVSTVIIEDVITTGTQVQRTATLAEEQGATIQGIVALVDREAGAIGLLKRWNYYPLLTVRDLGVITVPSPAG